MLKISELSRRQCSFILTIGVEDPVLLPWAAQYFWAIEFAQFLKAASFEVVAKLVELVQIACAEDLLRISDWMDSAHCFSLTPCHCASAAAGGIDDDEIITAEATKIEARCFMNSGLREILFYFLSIDATPCFLHPLNGGFWMVVSRYWFIELYKSFQYSYYHLNLNIHLQIHR